MLAEIRRDQPLREDTDLFKYGLRDVGFASRFDYLLAELLDTGHVAVDRWPLHRGNPKADLIEDREDPVQIRRVSWKNEGGDGRAYCTPDGTLLVSVLHTFYD